MKLSLSRRTVAIAVIGVGGIALGVGTYWLVHWGQERTIRKRLESLDGLIRRYCREQRLPPELVRAVIRIESKGDPTVVSNKDAYGLMQIRDGAKKEVRRVKKVPDGDLADPDYNLRIGTTYLRMMLDRFKGDVCLALAAYNCGPTSVSTIQREHPGLSSQELIETYAPGATRVYCRKVLEYSGVPATLPTTPP